MAGSSTSYASGADCDIMSVSPGSSTDAVAAYEASVVS